MLLKLGVELTLKQQLVAEEDGHIRESFQSQLGRLLFKLGDSL